MPLPLFVATHESAHAVVGSVLGFAVVGMKFGQHACGLTWDGRPVLAETLFAAPAPDCLYHRGRVTLLAGRAAEQRLDPDQPSGADLDLCRVHEGLRRCYGLSDRALIECANRQARDLVATHWPAIVRLADLLIRRGELGIDLEAVLPPRH